MSVPSTKKSVGHDPKEPLQIATFRVGVETFGLDIMRIKEVVRPIPVTHVPRAPFGMIGVARLRSRVIPVVDVRLRFGAPVGPSSNDARFVIITLDGTFIALVVDDVKDMVTAERRDVRLASSALAGDAARFFVGVLSKNDDLVLLLNVRRLLKEVTAVNLDDLVATEPTAGETAR